jgi:phosphinothricin acetyltransferase
MAAKPAPPSGRAIALVVRPAFEMDLQWVQLIYAHHVMTGTGTFETEPPSLEEIKDRWRRVVGRGWPWLVGADAADQTRIYGFAYAQPFRDRAAYAGTFENSVYVTPGALGGGIGTALMAGLLGELQAIGARQVIAVIGDSANAASIKLHAKAGFRVVGRLDTVGVKFGRELDVVMMQRAIPTRK